MRIKLVKFLLVAICLCSTLLVSAQSIPGDTSGWGPGIERDDEPDPVDAPVDNHLLILASVGLGIAFMRFRAVGLKNE